MVVFGITIVVCIKTYSTASSQRLNKCRMHPCCVLHHWCVLRGSQHTALQACEDVCGQCIIVVFCFTVVLCIHGMQHCKLVNTAGQMHILSMLCLASLSYCASVLKTEWQVQDADGKELFHLQRGFAVPVHLCYPCGQVGVSPLKVCSGCLSHTQ